MSGVPSTEMSLRRFVLASAGFAALALAAALPTNAKEGVEATLKSTIPLDAPADTRLNVRWTLGYVEDGKWQPFGASGLYVRLRSATGAQPTTAWAGGDRGRYWAKVVVPKGGIGDIEFGLVGWQTDANGTRRADAIFPITNDPLPGDLRASSASDGRGDSSMIWLAILVGVTLATPALLRLLARRRPLSPA
jgi:hypothetical protein